MKLPRSYVFSSSIHLVLFAIILTSIILPLTILFFPNPIQLLVVIFGIYLPNLVFLIPRFSLYFSIRKAKIRYGQIARNSKSYLIEPKIDYRNPLPSAKYWILVLLSFGLMLLLGLEVFGKITNFALFFFPLLFFIVILLSYPIILMKYKFSWHTMGYFDEEKASFILAGNLIYSYREEILVDHITEVAVKNKYSRITHHHIADIFISTDVYSLRVARIASRPPIQVYEKVKNYLKLALPQTDIRIIQISKSRELPPQRLFTPALPY